MKTKAIFGNYILSTTNTLLSLLFPLITFPYVFRILGRTNLGIVNFAQSYGYYFVHFANFGVSSYAVREISKVRDNKELLERKTNEIFNINFAFSFFSWVLYLIISLTVPKLRENLLILFIYSFVILSNFLSIEWILQSFDDYRFSTIRNCIIRVLALVSVFIFVKTEKDFITYMAISTVSEMGSRISTLRYSNKKYVRLRLNKQYLKFTEHIKDLFTLFSFRLVNGISAQLDKLMIGFMLVYACVSVYSAGVKMVLMLAPIVETIGIVLFPTINIALGESKDTYKKLVMINYRLVLLMGIPMAVGLYIMAPTIVNILAGDGGVGAINVLRIMAIVVVIGPTGDLLGSKILLVNNKNRELLICSTIVAVSNIVLNFLFIPIWEIEGAAFASVICYIIAVLSRLFFSRKVMKFSILTYDVFKYGLFTVPFVVIYYFFNDRINKNLLFAVGFVIVAVIIYILELVISKDHIFMKILEKIKRNQNNE